MHGGADEHKTYGDLYELNILTTSWKCLSVNGFAKPSPRYGHSFISIGNKILLFGGLAQDNDTELVMDESVTNKFRAPPFMGRTAPEWYHQAKPNDDLFLLDTQTMTWSRPAADSAMEDGSFPRARGFHAAVIVHKKLIVYGGAIDSNFRPNDELWILDGVHTLDSEAAKNAIASTNMLDLDSTTTTNTTSKIHSESLMWHKISLPEGSDRPGPRIAMQGCVTENGRTLFFGGRGDCSAVWELHGLDKDISASREDGKYNIWWQKIKVLHTAPLPRVFHSMTSVAGKVYVFAGITPVETSDLYVLDEKDMRWRKPLFEGTVNLRGHGACGLNDKLIIFGGARDKPSASSISAGGAGQQPGGSGDNTTTAVQPAAQKAAGNTSGDDPLAEDAWNRLSRKLLFLSVLQVKEGSDSDMKFKLITVGDSGVGKSCLLTRFVVDTYRESHIATLGLDFKTVTTMVKGRLVKLQLWDTAGQERFGTVTGQYFRGADGFLFVYDCSRRETFDHVKQWMSLVEEHLGNNSDLGVKLFISNKHDLPSSQIQVTEEEGRNFAESVGGVFVAASAKTSQNVDLAFLQVAARLVDSRRKQTSARPLALSGANSDSSNPNSTRGLRLGSQRSDTGDANGCANGGSQCSGSSLSVQGFAGRLGFGSAEATSMANPATE